MSIRAVIWDFGGVLMRTEDRGPRTRLGERFGLTYEQIDALVFGTPSARRAALGEIPVEAHWKEVCQALGQPISELPGIQDDFWGGDTLDSGLIEYIRSLRQHYRTGLLSNAWSDLRQALNEIYHIQDAFDTLVISAELGMIKPDPRIYLHAAQALGVAPQDAVFVDDVLENVQGARQAGLSAVQFRNQAQAIADVNQLLQR